MPDIRELLSETRVSFDLKAKSKEEVINELIDILDRDGKLYDRGKFKEAVLKREQEFSTGIGFGIAIPHGKDDSVKEPAITFGVSKTGVDFNSFDGMPARIFFLISVPMESNDMHLKILSEISRKLMHENIRKALMNARVYEDILNAFEI